MGSSRTHRMLFHYYYFVAAKRIVPLTLVQVCTTIIGNNGITFRFWLGLLSSSIKNCTWSQMVPKDHFPLDNIKKSQGGPLSASGVSNFTSSQVIFELLNFYLGESRGFSYWCQSP